MSHLPDSCFGVLFTPLRWDDWLPFSAEISAPALFFPLASLGVRGSCSLKVFGIIYVHICSWVRGVYLGICSLCSSLFGISHLGRSHNCFHLRYTYGTFLISPISLNVYLFPGFIVQMDRHRSLRRIVSVSEPPKNTLSPSIKGGNTLYNINHHRSLRRVIVVSALKSKYMCIITKD